MTAARYTKIDLGVTSYYHCMSRCVRRAFLCGKDFQTGKNYSHRKKWIVNGLKKLSKVFAIKVCAYAVMSNHYHLVLFLNAIEAKRWDDSEVISRWKSLFPIDAAQLNELSEERAKEKINLWRERLMNISWFMRCLNQDIACLSNIEDKCKGRFWEGRFKSQALLDEGAILTAMAYVDLNPIRAKLASTPEESEFTSIYERIKAMKKELEKKASSPSDSENVVKQLNQPKELMAFANDAIEKGESKINFNLVDYLQLVDVTGRIIREDKKGAIPDELCPILMRLNLTSEGWLKMVNNIENNFFLAIGDVTSLLNFRQQFRTNNPRGISSAKQYYVQAA